MESLLVTCFHFGRHRGKPHVWQKTSLAFAVGIGLLAVASEASACIQGNLIEALNVALPEKPSQSFDVIEPVSAEGGGFDVYENAAGVPQTIVRTDYGETYRIENRMFIHSNANFIIRSTKFEYAAPIYEAGSKVVREIIENYEVCDGKLEVPAKGDALNDTAGYRKAAIEVYQLITTAPEIAKTVKPLKLTPPPWQ